MKKNAPGGRLATSMPPNGSSTVNARLPSPASNSMPASNVPRPTISRNAPSAKSTSRNPIPVESADKNVNATLRRLATFSA